MWHGAILKDLINRQLAEPQTPMEREISPSVEHPFANPGSLLVSKRAARTPEWSGVECSLFSLFDMGDADSYMQYRPITT